jgi:hypothetical protein
MGAMTAETAMAREFVELSFNGFVELQRAVKDAERVGEGAEWSEITRRCLELQKRVRRWSRAEDRYCSNAGKLSLLERKGYGEQLKGAT